MNTWDKFNILINKKVSDERLMFFLDSISEEEYKMIFDSITSDSLKERILRIKDHIDGKYNNKKENVLLVFCDDKKSLEYQNKLCDYNNDTFNFITYNDDLVYMEYLPLIDYIRSSDSKAIIIDGLYLIRDSDKQFIYDMQLFFPEMIIVVIIGRATFRMYYRGSEVCNGDCDDVKSLVSMLSKFNTDNVYVQDFTDMSVDIDDYCVKCLSKYTSSNALEINFNEFIFNRKQISFLIERCKKIIDKDGGVLIKANKFIFNDEQEYTRDDEIMKESMKTISIKYAELHKKLLQDIKGQDVCVEKTVRALFESELDMPSVEDKRTLSTLFFFGPSGTGKTFLAEKIAEYLGYDYKLFHMEGYSMEGDQISLIGSDTQFRNSRRGDLPVFIDSCMDKKHIIVFDEIEKASHQLLNSLLSSIGQGVLHDQYRNRDIYLNNSILIFTSNAGRSLFSDTSSKFSTVAMPVLLDALKQEKRTDGTMVFSPEFCSRIMSSHVITFDHLSVYDLNNIVKNNQDKLIKSLKEKNGLKVRLDKRLSLISIYHTGRSDARIASQYSKQLVKNEIFEVSRFYNDVDLDKLHDVSFEVDFADIDKEIKTYFVRNKKIKIAVIGDSDIIKKFDCKSKDYDIIQIKNEKELKDSLNSNVFEYYVDPFFGGIEEKALSITDYNSLGINYLYKIVDSYDEVPVYILENNKNNISETDRMSLVHDGVKKIVNTDKEDFKNKVLEIIDEDYLEEQINTLTQKGFILDFNTKQKLSKDGKSLIVTLYDFKKYMAYDFESQNIMLKESDTPKEKFDDVIDCEEAKRELKYYINYLNNPIDFVLDGARVPKGVLLFGPPGTGKTMLARAMAGEAKVNFINTTAADLLGKVVGDGEQNIRKLFSKARKYAPTIVFIDEIDSIGKKRSKDSIASALTALLTEMDGFKQNTKKPVFVLAATNYGVGARNNEISELDSALVRRFDSCIYVGNPNKEGRRKFIELYLHKKSITNISRGTINTLVDCTVGQSLAIIENILELAYRTAKIKNEKIVDGTLLSALDQYQNGEIKQTNPKVMKRTAIHEAGHAFISYMCGLVPSYVTIEARGNYGGYVASEEADISAKTITSLLDIIKVCLAGKAAQEVLISKEVSLNTGTYDDLRKASNIALEIACNLGIDDKLLTLGLDNTLSSPYSAEYMDRANNILDEQYKMVLSLIKKNKKIVKDLSNLLLDKGHATKDELLDFFKNKELL